MKKIKFILCFTITCFLLFFQTSTDSTAAEVENPSAKIHFLTLDADSDAIILESNGHFGMIDAGDDSGYPDGSNPRYPLRKGTLINAGTENQVIKFMENLGINSQNFDFFIGTHAHSDHIGAAATIIKQFKPSRVYISEYDDSFITNASALWDNQYVYDNLLLASKEAGSTVILNFDPTLPANTITDISASSSPTTPTASLSRTANVSSFSDNRANSDTYKGKNIVGKSVKNKADTDDLIQSLKKIRNNAKTSSTTIHLGEITLEFFNYDVNSWKDGVVCANAMSLCVKIAAFNHTAFLGGDLLKEQETSVAPLIGSVDLMKYNHHGISTSNSTDFVTTLSPKIVVATGSYKNLSPELLDSYVPIYMEYHTKTYATTWFSTLYSAISFDMLDLSNNISPSDLIITSTYSNSLMCFQNGQPYSGLGIIKYKKNAYLLVNSPYVVHDGWFFVNSSWYYANQNGVLERGWIADKNNNYYLGSNYQMLTGWVSYNGNWYYLKADGILDKGGWRFIDGSWYYLSESGYAATGWILHNNLWYYLDSDCKMATGWLTANDNTYFLDLGGSMITGWRFINGAWYYFNNSGALLKGKQTIDGIVYHLDNQNGALLLQGWNYTDGHYYYYGLNGLKVTGWKFINENWYYFNENGLMLSGWQNIDEQRYYLGPPSCGRMLIGWQIIDGLWYYFANNGVMLKGVQKINDTIYYLDENSGSLPPLGWSLINDSYYYFNSVGQKATGWLYVNNRWYYLTLDGLMLSGWQDINGQRYYLGSSSSGAMVTNWQIIDGNWYYFTLNGYMLTGKHQIDGIIYLFDESGKWIP